MCWENSARTTLRERERERERGNEKEMKKKKRGEMVESEIKCTKKERESQNRDSE